MSKDKMTEDGDGMIVHDPDPSKPSKIYKLVDGKLVERDLAEEQKREQAKRGEPKESTA